VSASARSRFPEDGDGLESWLLVRWYRRRIQKKIKTPAKNAHPPTTPPTMAPSSFDDLRAEVELGSIPEVEFVLEEEVAPLDTEIEVRDAELEAFDTEIEALDAEMELLDAESEVLDAGMEALDAGMVVLDSGMEALGARVEVPVGELPFVLGDAIALGVDSRHEVSLPATTGYA